MHVLAPKGVPRPHSVAEYPRVSADWHCPITSSSAAWCFHCCRNNNYCRTCHPCRRQPCPSSHYRLSSYLRPCLSEKHLGREAPPRRAHTERRGNEETVPPPLPFPIFFCCGFGKALSHAWRALLSSSMLSVLQAMLTEKPVSPRAAFSDRSCLAISP